GTGDLVKQPDEDNAEFLIPAGASGHIEENTWTWKLPNGDISIYGMGTHMHLSGRDERVTVDHTAPTAEEGDSECLIETPHWDFNWQRGYGYNAPLDQLSTFHDGDTLHIRCVYDNTLDNPAIAQALGARDLDQPIDIRLGEDTLDEMCLTAVGIEYPNVQ
ncbi:MAG TPA: hypothetical protein VGI70_14170, partial [Polyangiales bacterium]